MKPNPYSVKSSVRKKFFDNFVRNNTDNDLGIVSDGSRWDNVRGVFKVLFNRAVSETPPSQYPIATVTMPVSDVDIAMADVDNGSGVSLWVTDAGNWFAVGVDQHPVDCNCEVGTECNRWNASTITGWTTRETGGRNAFTVATGQFCTGGNVNTIPGNTFNVYAGRWPATGCRQFVAGGQCVAWYTYFINRYVPSSNATTYSYNTRTCNTNFSTRYNAPNFTSNINGYNAKTCNRWNEFTFNCEECYPQWIRVLQSINGTVSTLLKVLATEGIEVVKSPNETLDLFVQENPITRFVRSFFVKTRGSEIAVDAFSDPGSSERILFDGEDNFVYTPTGASISPEFGIVIVPSEYNQQNYIGGIDIERKDL